MAKSTLVMAFQQLPEAISSKFTSLYPEIVPVTPVSVVIDPEGRSVDFTIGTKEMCFGPDNENYAVFLNGCYRMVFEAAQKEGWLALYQQEAAATPEVTPAPQEAATPPPPPAPAAPEAPLTPKAASVQLASTDLNPTGGDQLYVRPLDYVNGLRQDWTSWATAHGGPETMHEQGVLDEAVGLPPHHKASAEFAEKSGWSTESSVWTNPKGIKVADDSRLVAQIRGVSKKAADGEAQLMGHTDNPVEKLADGTSGEAKIQDEVQVQKIATASEYLKEVSTAKTASGPDFLARIAAVKKAFSPEVAHAVDSFLQDNY